VLVDGSVIAVGRVLLSITPESPRLDLPTTPAYLPAKSIGAYYRVCVLYSQYWPMDRPTSSQPPPPIALHLLPTNHNNNTQRVDYTTRLLIGLGVCILLPYPIERAGVTPLTAHAFAYAVRHRRRVCYYETPSLDQPSSLNHRLYYESSSCLDYSLPP